MFFDEPINLDPGSFEDLMVDTDQHRICWMYHDILSQARIAWLFDQYAGERTSICKTWTTMAWVAAACQPDSFYLLFKWYGDRYDRPQRSDLYFVQRVQGQERVRFLHWDHRHRLPPRVQDWFDRFPGRVSDNASFFVGDSDFGLHPIGHILRFVGKDLERVMEKFDWYFCCRSDWENALLCATIAAYFHCVQAAQEMVAKLLPDDLGRLPVRELVERLKPAVGQLKEEQIPVLDRYFQHLSEEFCSPTVLSPYLSRSAGRLLMDMTQTGRLRWLRLGSKGAQRLLRDLYGRCAPRQRWDVFVGWRGETYCTVLRRPLTRELVRGVYLITRFKDRTGQEVLGFFFLETLSVGVVHLCQGEFFEALMDLLHGQDTRSGSFPSLRPREDRLVEEYSDQLKEMFDEYGG